MILELRHDVMLFPNGLEKAFTLSYDDGVIQDKRFIELLKKYGLKATFNLNSGTFGDVDYYQHLVVDHVKINADEVKALYDGYEVAVHTITHPDLPKIPASMIAYEVSGDKHNLEELVGYPIRGMAYPFGTYNDRVVDVLINSGIEYARTVKSTHKFAVPEDFLMWHPTCHHDDNALIDLADQFLQTKASASIFYVWGHTYEFDNNNNWDKLEDFFEKISGKDSIWYATNIEIVDYINAVKQLKYSADGKIIYNPTAQTIWLRIFRKDYKIASGETIHISH